MATFFESSLFHRQLCSVPQPAVAQRTPGPRRTNEPPNPAGAPTGFHKLGRRSIPNMPFFERMGKRIFSATVSAANGSHAQRFSAPVQGARKQDHSI